MTADVKITLSAKDNTRAAADSAKRNLAGIQATATKLNAVMGSLASVGGLGALAGGLSAGAFVGFVKSVTDSVDALNDVRDATGASIETISALDEVARRTGTGLDVVQTSLVKLNQVLNTASDPNSGAAGALNAIGLSADELKKLDPAEALLEVAKALDSYADDANKARIIQELFGKSLKEVAPLLHDLAEQGKLNATVTTAQAQEAEKFNKQLFELQTNIVNAGRAIAMSFVPAISQAVEEFKLGMKYADGFWSALWKFGLANPFKDLPGHLRVLQNEFEQIDFRLSNGRSQNPEKDKARLADLEKEIGYYRELQALKEGRPETKAAEAPKPSVNSIPQAAAAPKAPKAATKDYDAALEMSRRSAEAYAATLGKLVDAQYDAEQSTLDLTPSQKALRDLMADPVWQTMPVPWQQTAIAQTEAAVAAEKSAADLKRLNDLVAATPTAQLEKQREEMQFLADAFERGTLTAEQFAETAGTALGTLPKLAEVAADEMDQFMIQAARNIQDAFADFLFDPFKDGIDGMLKDFGQVIQRMIAQAVAADLGKRLFGADMASGKSGGVLGGWAKTALDWVTGLFKSANGNAFAPAGPVAAFANGGAFGNGEILTAPTMFRFADGGAFRMGVAGEAGEEAALPLKRMSNGKLGVYADGGGQQGGDIHVHMTVPPGTPAQQRASIAQQGREVGGYLKRMARYG